MSVRTNTAVPGTRLIVIGASAGGLQPLLTVIAALPADLPAAVLVVMHVSPTATSRLPEILARAS
ncbi:MAG: CheB methylesterase, partial [Baekduia sp.]|nr:CheB methylesterase [Baekduia sp.]